MVQRGHQVAVAGEFLRPGGVLGAHPARPGREQHDREPFAAPGHRGVEDRTAAGVRDTVDQEVRQADAAGEGGGDGARLVLRAPEVLGPRRTGGALLRGVPELDHDRAPVGRIGGEGLRPLLVGPLQHPGADRELARGLGEHGDGEGPGGHRTAGDQPGAGQRSRQRQPPAGPPRGPAGPAPPQGSEDEGQDEGGAGQDGQQLPAEPGHPQHEHGQEEHRPRRDRGARAGRGGQPAHHHQGEGTQQGKDFQGGHEQSRDDLGHGPIVGAGPPTPHRSRVATRSDRRRAQWASPLRPGWQANTPDRRPRCDRGRCPSPPPVVHRPGRRPTVDPCARRAGGLP